MHTRCISGGYQVDTRWIPGGYQVDIRWKTGGYQVDTLGTFQDRDFRTPHRRKESTGPETPNPPPNRAEKFLG